MKTKIIATVGPGCSKQSDLQTLAKLGVSCFRVNLSHGNEKQKKEFFKKLNKVQLYSGLRPAILADLAGPKIRVREQNVSIRLKAGETIYLSSEKAGKNTVLVTENVKFQKVSRGAKILIDDGRISLEVVDHTSSSTLQCKALEGGIIENNKGVNFPGVSLQLPVLTKQDIADLKIALDGGADWMALSFVRSPKDYNIIREQINAMGFSVPILAKIEKWEAVHDLDEIIKTFDAVMVARGDLGVELPIEKVPLIQNEVIQKAGEAGKPVIIATQILDSMTERPVPTRAEVSDIANAILDGADALMVTGETAIGKHPQKVIEVLGRVIKETENSINYKNFYQENNQKKLNTSQAISHAACSVATEQQIDILVTMTHSGSTARMVSRYRPVAKIIAMTPFEKTCRQLLIVWGVNPVLVQKYNSADEIPEIANESLKKKGLLIRDQKYVLTGGVPVGIPGTTNYLSVLKAV